MEPSLHPWGKDTSQYFQKLPMLHAVMAKSPLISWGHTHPWASLISHVLHKKSPKPPRVLTNSFKQGKRSKELCWPPKTHENNRYSNVGSQNPLKFFMMYKNSPWVSKSKSNSIMLDIGYMWPYEFIMKHGDTWCSNMARKTPCTHCMMHGKIFILQEGPWAFQGSNVRHGSTHESNVGCQKVIWCCLSK